MKEFRMRDFKIRRLGLLLIMFLLVMNLGAAENFYNNYSESERLVIAGAYLAVSEQYKELGDSDKASAFREMADQIFPGVTASAAVQKSTETTIQPEQIQAAAPVRPSGKEPAAVQYYFSKMMRAVFSENEADLVSLLTTRLYLPGYDEGVKKEDAQAYIRMAFAEYELDRIDPSSAYELNRIYIKPEGSAWTAAVDLTPAGQAFFESELGFKGETQIFYFREFREGWRLIAISAE